jgi:YesN/AraC family two-component response regulator
VNPLLYDSRFDVLFFPASENGVTISPITEWHTQALERIKVLAELTRQSPDESALEVQSRFYGLFSLLFANTVALENASEKAILQRDDFAIKRMIAFIQNNFNTTITLDEIAQAGMVCRSKCCRLFKENLKESAFDYLLRFRIRQSLSLLTNETLNITEVALAFGFSAASYYGEIFKRLLGMSPGEYRRKFLSGDTLPRM